MNKTEFVDAFADKVSCTKVEAGKIVNSFFELIIDTLSKGNDIRVVGFGTFKVVNVKEKNITNPQNGSKMTVPASKRVRFAVGKALKDAVNN